MKLITTLIAALPLALGDIVERCLRKDPAERYQDLQQMRRAGLLAVRREGKFMFYRLADDAVLDLLASLRRVAERSSAEGAQVVDGGGAADDGWWIF